MGCQLMIPEVGRLIKDFVEKFYISNCFNRQAKD
jgi:hypothetical protein